MNTRNFALLFGIAFLAIGLGGFFFNTHAEPEHGLTLTHQYGKAYGLFPVNTLHNIVHILFGLWGLAASRGPRGALFYARSVAIIYALLAVMGFVPTLNTTFGLVPLYGNDIWLHALLAAVAAYFGFLHRDARAHDRT